MKSFGLLRCPLLLLEFAEVDNPFWAQVYQHFLAKQRKIKLLQNKYLNEDLRGVINKL
jgi:hypothetical protein